MEDDIDDARECGCWLNTVCPFVYGAVGCTGSCNVAGTVTPVYVNEKNCSVDQLLHVMSIQ